jgi:hypothetical protein
MDYVDDCTDDGIIERFVSMNSVVMACNKEDIYIFFYFMFFIFSILFFFFFQSCYKGYSLHDYKLKNTQECITQMLTSKPMYKENKCMWGCITRCRSCTIIKPCVRVCMLPRPKAGSKTSFGATRSFFPKL